MTHSLEDMIQAAKNVLSLAYTPYSQFKVGACIRSSNNRLYVGCNVENAAYNLCCCAETNAIGNMITHGDQQIEEALILSSAGTLCPPCGGCRQQLAEFSTDTTMIHLIAEETQQHILLNDLLPLSFKPSSMETS